MAILDDKIRFAQDLHLDIFYLEEEPVLHVFDVASHSNATIFLLGYTVNDLAVPENKILYLCTPK